jgi:hypothetical protein
MGNRGSHRSSDAKPPLSTKKNNNTQDPAFDPAELERSMELRTEQRRLLNSRDTFIADLFQSHVDREDSLGKLNVLPDECVLRIISCLSISDLSNFASTSKYAFFLSRDENLWKALYRRHLYKIKALCPAHDGGDTNLEDLSDLLDSKRRNGESSKTTKKRKRWRGGRGKWMSICLRNVIRFNGDLLVITEGILGWPLERVNDLFGNSDEVTTVNRNGAYHYYHSVGLSVCFEDDRVTSVLKHVALESCTGPAYMKIIPN